MAVVTIKRHKKSDQKYLKGDREVTTPLVTRTICYSVHLMRFLFISYRKIPPVTKMTRIIYIDESKK